MPSNPQQRVSFTQACTRTKQISALAEQDPISRPALAHVTAPQIEEGAMAAPRRGCRNVRLKEKKPDAGRAGLESHSVMVGVLEE